MYLINTAKEHIEGKISINEAFAAEHKLKNRYMHIDLKNESAIIDALIKNPTITQKELASIVGKSERTIKTRNVEMQYLFTFLP